MEPMTPYYEDEAVTLYHGDYRDILPALDLDAGLEADLVLTDPPYGETSLDWDVWPEDWPDLLSAYSYAMWCFGSMRMFLDQRDQFKPMWRLSQHHRCTDEQSTRPRSQSACSSSSSRTPAQQQALCSIPSLDPHPP
jgi:hypothetical protein